MSYVISWKNMAFMLRTRAILLQEITWEYSITDKPFWTFCYYSNNFVEKNTLFCLVFVKFLNILSLSIVENINYIACLWFIKVSLILNTKEY